MPKQLLSRLAATCCLLYSAFAYNHPAKAKKAPTSQVTIGKRWFVKFGCDVCHTTDGTDSFGGTLKGIYGTHATLENRKLILRDDAYFRAKIAFSAKMPLANGTNTMPIYKDSLSTPQMTAIIALIKSLRTPKPTSKPTRKPASKPTSKPTSN